MSTHNRFGLCFLLSVSGCGPSAQLKMTDGSNWQSYAQDRDGGAPSGELDELRFKEGLCGGEPMKPERKKLNEGDVIDFLKRQQLDVRLERPRADLVYAVVNGAGTSSPVRLRIAILEDAEAAGLELHEAILEHGQGSWGVHRSNLAVLGPVGDYRDDIVFAAKTKLACWGVFTVAGRDESFVVPGGYMEI
jgi:hypothetical protein